MCDARKIGCSNSFFFYSSLFRKFSPLHYNYLHFLRSKHNTLQLGKVNIFTCEKKMFKIILFVLLCTNVDSLPYHYAKNRQRVSRGHNNNNSRLSPSISLGLNEAAFSKYREESQVNLTKLL